VKQLIAMGILADGMIQVFQGQGVNQEQRRAQPLAMEELGVGDDELEDLGYAINKLFGGEG
jgi:hypothetical protein